MSDNRTEMQSSQEMQFVLHPHRSLKPSGFLIMMVLISLVSFIVGMVFFLMGAWPVFGFFGLDVALIYGALRLNYRSGLEYEMLHLTRDLLTLTHIDPSGRRRQFEFNPYWARVNCRVDRPDGRTSLWLSAQGKAVRFGRFLTDEERRNFANALTGALIASRGSKF